MLAKLKSGTLESRTCPISKTNEVADETHFVINCNGYTTKRTYFFSYICNNVSNIQLMTLENAISRGRFDHKLIYRGAI